MEPSFAQPCCCCFGSRARRIGCLASLPHSPCAAELRLRPGHASLAHSASHINTQQWCSGDSDFRTSSCGLELRLHSPTWRHGRGRWWTGGLVTGGLVARKVAALDQKIHDPSTFPVFYRRRRRHLMVVVGLTEAGPSSMSTTIGPSPLPHPLSEHSPIRRPSVTLLCHSGSCSLHLLPCCPDTPELP